MFLQLKSKIFSTYLHVFDCILFNTSGCLCISVVIGSGIKNIHFCHLCCNTVVVPPETCRTSFHPYSLVLVVYHLFSFPQMFYLYSMCSGLSCYQVYLYTLDYHHVLRSVLVLLDCLYIYLYHH